ncbi:ABC transporter family substrate-binding protein [Skermania piniformis]
MRSHRLIRIVVPVLATGLMLSGCNASEDGAVGAGATGLGNTSDINPKDPAELRDGGNLRLALSGFPAQFNPLQVDSDGEASSVATIMLPGDMTPDASGALSVRHDYFTDVQLTGTDPQQVSYTINPKANWSDGTPITWEDLAAQANALSGRDPGYLITANAGFDRVAKVERGTDDRQAIVTYSKHYAEWQGSFSPLLPKSVTSTPEAFNDSLRNGLPVTAGPFKLASVDKGANRIVLERDPAWWGTPPKLDTITFTVLNHAAQLAGLQNNELDAVELGSSLDEVKTAQGSAGIQVRHAPANRWSQYTFNGAPGALLADPKLRVAIGKAIDRQGIATAILNGLVTDPHPLNNHIFLEGQQGYQDNAEPIGYDPDKAARELDALGWTPGSDGIREKDGRKLVLRHVMYQQDTWVRSAQIAQQNLAKVGVKTEIQTFPGTGLFTDVIDPGNFELASFSWSGGFQPLAALRQIYAYYPDDLQSNKARIGSPELNQLIEDTLSELDPAKAIQMANRADRMIFEEGHSIPLTQSAGNVAVRDNLANYGAFGLAGADYTEVGFTK